MSTGGSLKADLCSLRHLGHIKHDKAWQSEQTTSLKHLISWSLLDSLAVTAASLQGFRHLQERSFF